MSQGVHDNAGPGTYVHGVPIEQAMSAPWAWQPRWTSELATP
jgi:hypothetical protein